MMPLKVVIIGALGHIGYAYETLIAGREAVPCGIASGTDGDLPDAREVGSTIEAAQRITCCIHVKLTQ